MSYLRRETVRSRRSCTTTNTSDSATDPPSLRVCSRGLDSSCCTLHSVVFPLCLALRALRCNMLLALCTVLLALRSTHCARCTVLLALRSFAPCFVHCVRCTVIRALCSLHCASCPVFLALCFVYSVLALCFMYCASRIVLRTLCSLHCASRAALQALCL